MATKAAEAGKESAPILFFTIATAAITGVFFYALIEHTHMTGPMSALIALNGSAFILCGYDKSAGGSKKTSVPDPLLWLCALLGASPGLLLGMKFFGHKTGQHSFVIVLVLILCAQLAFIRHYGADLRPIFLAQGY